MRNGTKYVVVTDQRRRVARLAGVSVIFMGEHVHTPCAWPVESARPVNPKVVKAMQRQGELLDRLHNAWMDRPEPQSNVKAEQRARVELKKAVELKRAIRAFAKMRSGKSVAEMIEAGLNRPKKRFSNRTKVIVAEYNDLAPGAQKTVAVEKERAVGPTVTVTKRRKTKNGYVAILKELPSGRLVPDRKNVRQKVWVNFEERNDELPVTYGQMMRMARRCTAHDQLVSEILEQCLPDQTTQTPGVPLMLSYNTKPGFKPDNRWFQHAGGRKTKRRERVVIPIRANQWLRGKSEEIVKMATWESPEGRHMSHVDLQAEREADAISRHEALTRKHRIRIQSMPGWRPEDSLGLISRDGADGFKQLEPCGRVRWAKVGDCPKHNRPKGANAESYVYNFAQQYKYPRRKAVLRWLRALDAIKAGKKPKTLYVYTKIEVQRREHNRTTRYLQNLMARLLRIVDEKQAIKIVSTYSLTDIEAALAA